jgi:hypothetical protein
LELRCLKWACMTHFHTSNTWPKERSGIKLAIWLLTTKSRESPRFPCVHAACNIPLKSSWQGLERFFRPHLNQRFARKFVGIPIVGISRLPFGSCGTKWHLGADPVAMHKVYYKGEGGGFPQVRAVMSLGSLCLLVARLCTKVFQLRTNQLVVWFVQVCVSNWCLSLLLVPILELQHAPLPPKCYEPGSVPQFFTLSLFSF